MVSSWRSNAGRSKEPSAAHGIQLSVGDTDRHFQLGKKSLPVKFSGSKILIPSEMSAA
jgi:hypothetical protein